MSLHFDMALKIDEFCGIPNSSVHAVTACLGIASNATLCTNSNMSRHSIRTFHDSFHKL